MTDTDHGETRGPALPAGQEQVEAVLAAQRVEQPWADDVGCTAERCPAGPGDLRPGLHPQFDEVVGIAGPGLPHVHRRPPHRSLLAPGRPRGPRRTMPAPPATPRL